MTLQNKAIKIIGGVNPLEDATPVYFKFKILKISDLYKLQIGKIVQAHFNNKLPCKLSNCFKKASDISALTTRHTKPTRKT